MIQLFCALFKICFQTFGARDFRCGNVLQKNEFLMQPLVLFFGIRYNLAIMKMSFPKSIKRFLVMGALLPLVFLSCLSTPKQDSPGDSNGTRSSTNSSEDEKSSLKDVNISVISSPKETSKGKAFSAPYNIHAAKSDGTPCASLSVIVEYPASRDADSISFEKETLVTDADGNATFSAPTPQFSAKSFVSFYPESSPALKNLAEASKATAAWNVRTNVTARSGILVSVVDYSQDGKMIVGGGAQPSTQALTAALWKGGLMGAQNADFHNSVDADDSARIQADAKRLVSGNTTFRYVVYGRVKYAEKMSQDAQGNWIVSLEGDAGALELATGKVLLKTRKSVSVKDKSQWNALKNAQEEMARQFAEEIVYGL